jgi:rhamnulokinase
MPEDTALPNPLANIAIDLGAESCRVSLLRWNTGQPVVEMVHRFLNSAVDDGKSLHWDLNKICTELETGLRKCAEIAAEGIVSIAVDGWGVDYVRLNPDGTPLHPPFCYRDTRTVATEAAAYEKLAASGIDRDRLFTLTGVEQLRINTIYQLIADGDAGIPAEVPWVELPEFILHWLGGERVAEWTNATHTGLVQPDTRQWCPAVFDTLGLPRTAAPKLVPPGTAIGKMTGALAQLPAFQNTVLIAAATHDTAAAIGGIPAEGDEWAYLSSGTWSLIGALLDEPCLTHAARAANFTNLGAVGNRFLFHKLVNGLWLLRQSMEQWKTLGGTWTVPQLVEAAESAVAPDGLIDVSDPDLLLPGDMPARINAQRQRTGLPTVSTTPESAPILARLIFESLAAKYAQTLQDVTQVSGKKINRLYVVGGGSQNKLLNRLTEKATGIPVICAAVESSTIGNFAIQLAVLEGKVDPQTGVEREAVARWAAVLR